MLRTRADVDRNQDYPRFVLSVIASSDFATASSLIPIFRVARPTSSSITVHCMRAQQYRYNIELVIPRYRLIIGAEAKFSPAGARYTSGVLGYLWPRSRKIHGRGIVIRAHDFMISSAEEKRWLHM